MTSNENNFNLEQLTNKGLAKKRIEGAVLSCAAISGMYALAGLSQATGNNLETLQYILLTVPFVTNTAIGATIGNMAANDWNFSTSGIQSRVNVGKATLVGAASGTLVTALFGPICYGIGYGIGS